MALQGSSRGPALVALATFLLAASCDSSEARRSVVGGVAASEAAPATPAGNSPGAPAAGTEAPAAPGGVSPSSGEGLGNVTRVDDGDTPSPSGATGSGGTLDPAPSAGCGSPAGLTSGRASIDVGGTTREYILLLPEGYDPEQPYRLIFGWHPWGGSARQIESRGYFGLESVVGGQAVLVAPEGQDFRGNGLGWGNEGGEDIAFLQAMLDRFSSQLCIDENRIFSTGFSFGAMFSFTLACSQSGRMRAIAPQAGNATTSGPCEEGTRSV